MEKAPGAKCDECPLKGQNFAPSEYARNERVKAFIISRSPGHHDTAAGRPFAGPSGKVLDHLLARNDVSRADVHTTNVVLCETDSLDGAKQSAVACCRPRLERELATVKTDTYIAAGAEALSALSNGKLRLRASRGQRIKGSDGKSLVATFNPAAALRDDVVFPDLVSDFRRAFTPERDIRTPEVTVAGNVDQALQIIDVLRRYEDGCVVAVDIESTGLSYSSKLLSIGFSPRDTRSFVIGRRSLEDSRVRDRLLQYLSLDHYKFLYHNGKFDVKLLRTSGITSAHVDEDTLLLSYLCDERPGVHSLDYLVHNELDWPNYEPATVAAGKKYGFSEQPVTRQLKTKVVVDYEGFSDWTGLYKYNGYDTAGSRQLFGILSTRAERERTTDVYRRLLIPASNCLADVEAHGVVFDADRARRIATTEVAPELSRLLGVLREVTGDDELNPNSPQQVARFVYDVCGVTNPLFRRDKERSVDAAVRLELLRTGNAPAHVLRFVRHLDRYKKLDKLRGTYLESLADRVDEDGRLRCDFLLHGTESGRLSSRNPNFQNIPRGGKDGLPNIRSLFIAPPGRVIVQADYSQAELRTIAITSGDENLLDIYRSGKDLHTEVATELFGENFTKEQRVLAKNYNFGIAYGQGAFSFSQMYHMSKAQAERDIGTWWSRFPGVWEWTRRVHKETRATGELMSAFGRKRRFPLITRDNLDHTLKEAVNFMIQSTASDFTVASLIRLMNDGELDLRRCYPIVLVHDSIVLEAESDYAKECGDIVREVMENTPTNYLGGQWNDIPFDADVQVGADWGAVA